VNNDLHTTSREQFSTHSDSVKSKNAFLTFSILSFACGAFFSQKNLACGALFYKNLVHRPFVSVPFLVTISLVLKMIRIQNKNLVFTTALFV